MSHTIYILPFYQNFFIYRDSTWNDIGIPKRVTEAEDKIADKVTSKTISFSEKSNFSSSFLDSETEYDEYEEDKDLVQWKLPKTKKLPTVSSLVCPIGYLSRGEI